MKFLYSLSLIIIFLLTGCTQPSEKIDNKQPTAFFNAGLGGFSPRDSIIVKARFSECGEWGGHEETIIIKLDNANKFYATYRVYDYNCDSISYYYNNKRLTPINTKNTLLNDKGKQSIVEYIQRLTNSKIEEENFSLANAGNIFSIVKSDSSFLINVYDNKVGNVESFRQLVAEVF